MFSPSTLQYIRDIADNVERVVDLLDTYKDISGSLESIYESEQEHKSNRTMYALSVVSTIFLPLTFVAGVYGMNFDM